MGGVAIYDWGVTVLDLSGVVHNNNLGSEGFYLFGWVVLVIRSNVTSLDILNRQVLNIESNVVSGLGFGQDFVMHFN